MENTNLLIFNKDLEFQFYLSNELPDACPFYDAPHKETLDYINEFEFRMPADHSNTDSVAKGGYVGFFDRDGDFQLFKIDLIEEEDSPENGIVRAVFCKHVFEETSDLPVEDKRPQDRTAAEALTDALALQSKWQAGTVDDLGTNSTNFYYESVKEALLDIQNTWGGEIKPRLTIDENNKITGYFIDLLTRRGADNGERIEIDRNAKNIKRKYDEEGIKTAIYPRGKGQQTESGGYTRRLTIADVEWSTANGDPVDKPLGQEWIGDPDALQEYGIDDGNGNKIHRFGFVNFDEDEDANVLIQKGWDLLQELNKPRVQYEAGIEVLALGDGVRLGDTVAVVDYNFTPAIVIKARIIELIDYKDREEIQVKIGNFMPAFSKQNEAVQKKLDELGGKTGAIEQGESGPIKDDDFEDITPEEPQNVTAAGLFKTIALKWDYDPSYNIAAYEVYGSQTAGFNPDSTTLLYRGKSGGYVHEVGASNQQWFYKVRAINPHGTAGPYSQEVSAQTIKINAKTDVQPLSITNELIAENAKIDFAKIANVEITNAMIANVSADKITGGSFEGKTFVGGTFEGGIIDGAIIRASSYFHFMPPDSNTAISMSGSVDSGTPSLGSLQVAYYNSSTEVPDELIKVLPNAIEYTGLSVGDNFRIVFSPYNILLEHNLRVEGNGSFTGGLSIDGALTSYGANFYGTVNLNGKSIDRVYSIKVGLVENDSLGDAHLYLKPSSGGEIRVIQSGTSGTYRPIRASNFYSTGSSSFGGGVSVNGDVSITGGYVKVNAIDHNGAGEHLYIRPLSSGEGRCTAIGTTTTYRPFRASSFPTSSAVEYKQDIHVWEESALELIRHSTIYEYRLKDEVANGIDRLRQGLVIGEGYNTPEGVVDGDGIEQYLMNTWSWKAIQELDSEQQAMKDRIVRLENKIIELEALVA